jgi:hypothetical protein
MVRAWNALGVVLTGGVMVSRWLRTHVARSAGARHIGEQERSGDNDSEEL